MEAGVIYGKWGELNETDSEEENAIGVWPM